VSYFTRLREQSGLAIVNGPVATKPEVPPQMVGSPPGAEELTEVVETREVGSEIDPTAADIVSLPPAVMPLDVDDTTRRQDPASMANRQSDRRDLVAADRSVSSPALNAEIVGARRNEGADLQASRESEPSGAAPLSREATLRHVFEWLAAPVPPPQSRERAVAAREESVRRASVLSPSAIEMVATSTTPEQQSARDRGVATVAIDATRADVVELADEPRRSRPATEARQTESTQEQVEEILTVSIGAIHMRVEAPPAAPVVAARSVDPVRPARPEGRQRSRLPRHYLRP
jgi:hypothetical protein